MQGLSSTGACHHNSWDKCCGDLPPQAPAGELVPFLETSPWISVPSK